MPSADQLERMKETAERSFVDLRRVVRRLQGAIDEDGDVSGPLASVATIDGTVGDPTARDLETAATEGERLDVILSTAIESDVRIGDEITARGRDWTVVTVRETRFLKRIGLRATA